MRGSIPIVIIVLLVFFQVDWSFSVILNVFKLIFFFRGLIRFEWLSINFIVVLVSIGVLITVEFFNLLL